MTIVIPTYNEEKTLLDNMTKLKEVLDNDRIDYKVLLIDDGSKDRTWDSIAKVHSMDSRFDGIGLSRNFGKELAICAGLKQVDTELALIMDSDLQHPPRYIKDMIRIMLDEGADIVNGVKANRGKESMLYKLQAKLFYSFFNSMSNIDLNNASDYKLLGARALDAINSMSESNVFFRGLVSWVGFKCIDYEFDIDDRVGDISRFSTMRLIRMSLNALVSYSSKPLYLVIGMSFIFLILSIILGVQTLFNFYTNHAVSGFTTVILLILIVGALILFSLGLIGIYLSKIYDEVKGRPRYIISRRTDVN